jgi:hypothetical protein
MKITEYVAQAINRLPKGYIFTYSDFIGEVKNKEALIKALNRMAVSGKISKLTKGKYYKPEKSEFGNLKPNRYQVVKDLLEDNGRLTGYLTGYSIYNQLGLTTQISNIIQIGKNSVRPRFKRAGYKISFVLQKNTITKENIPLLQILDSIRYIKKIPDTSISSACKRLLEIIRELSAEKISTIVRLALKYPPATRALLGAILEETGNYSLTKPLSKSLNPITTYNLYEAGKVLFTVKKWNIK